MSTLLEAKKKYKKDTGRAAHHTWDVETILSKLGDNENKKEDEIKPPKKEDEQPEKKKELKPVKATLFIPSYTKGNEKMVSRIVKQEDWTPQDTKDYRESYKDRLQKAMKQLK